MRKTKFDYIKRILLCTVLLIAVIGSTVVSAESQVPYDGYTYWTDTNDSGSRKSVYSKNGFEVKKVVDSDKIGVASFNEITDCYVDSSGIYLLDGGNSRITVLDKNYNLVREYGELNYNGELLNYKGARGIFLSNGRMYVCDTENGRVLVSDQNGIVSGFIEKPTSSLVPEEFQYRPIKVVCDSKGYLYVLSEGSYYGVLLFSPQLDFLGFFGSNKVTNGIAGVLNNIMSRVFPNNDKKAASRRVLPYSMSDMCIVDDNVIYTVTGSTSQVNQKDQIRKLFVGNGANILNTETTNFADEGYNTSSRGNETQYQDLCSIEVDSDGFVYALDSKYCRVLVYDTAGRMITAFGNGFGYGQQEGTFKKPVSVAVNGNDILVADGKKNSITVFEPTETFTLTKQGQILTLKGDYQSSYDIWNQVLSLDSNSQLAYCGLARYYYSSGDYDNALDYARKGYDRDTYALAFKQVRTDVITEYFWLFALIAVVVIAALIVAVKMIKKKGIVLIKNRKVKLMTSVLFHPIDTFTEIKEKQMTSVAISFVLLVVFYVTSVLKVLCGGFMFNYYDPTSFNAIWTLVQSVGLIVLWIVANWLVCSLMGGNGRIKEIITVACYSLIPLIISQVLQIILTNVLLPDEAAFLNIIGYVAYLFFFLMLTFGSIVIHDYGFGKFIGTSVLTVLAMAIVLFLIFLVIMLCQQFIGFISTIITELSTL